MARTGFSALPILGLLTVCFHAGAGTVVTRQGQEFSGDLELVANGILVTHTNAQTNLVVLTNVLRASFTTNRAGMKTSAPPVTISSNFNIALRQSPLDSLNGLEGKFRPGVNPARARAFTDAQSAQAPADDHGWFAGEITWDLGDEWPAVERQLDIVSIWIRASDRTRCDYAGALALSRDGETFRTVPGSHATVNFSEHPPRGPQHFHQVIYRFAPGAATDFRYLRLIAETPSTTFQQTRFVEIDAWVSRCEPQPRAAHVVLLRDGSELRGNITSLDDDSVTLLFCGDELRLPLSVVARLALDYGRVQSVTIPTGQTGVVLGSGQFLECEIRDLNAKSVTVTSILFGLRRYDFKRAVAAVILRDVRATTPAGVVVTRNGSRVSARAITFESARANVETTGGPVNIPAEELAEISFNSRAP